MALSDLSTVQIHGRVAVQRDLIADQLLPLVSWMPIRGDGLRIPEVPTLPAPPPDRLGTVQWVGASAFATANAAEPDVRLAPLKRVMGEFDLGEGYPQVYSGMLDQRQVQADIKRLLLRQAVGRALVVGSGASDEPGGLVSVSTNSTSGTSGTLTLTMLRDLLQRILTHGGHCDYLVMSGAMLNRFQNIYDTAFLPTPTVVDERTGLRHLAYSGVPILRNDHLPNTPGADSSIIALNLDAVTLIYPEGVGDRGLVTTELETRANGAVTMRLTQTVGVALLDQAGMAVLLQVRP